MACELNDHILNIEYFGKRKLVKPKKLSVGNLFLFFLHIGL